MKVSSYLAAAFVTTMAFTGGQALANTCRTEKLTCPTSMPVEGYCECTSHGTTEGGTVSPPESHKHVNATAGGCGTSPAAPGCH